MSPYWIVIVADPVGRRCFQARQRRPRASVDQLLLVGREERFRYGIVITDPRPSQGAPDVILSAVLVEHRGRVLAAAVRMEDDSRRRLPGSDGHIEGSGDQAGPH